MAKKLVETLYHICRDNTYAVMLEVLGQELGVSAAVLGRLGIGWAPVVQFKKGPNYSGWWVIPERSPTGEVTGLSLRNSSNGSFKAMYPGGHKRGLVYELNPQHRLGAEVYHHGAHNWVHTEDTQLECPICHRFSGCLVSAENPLDPRAVSCVRVKTGAIKALALGYLHIRKETGRIQASASPLPPSERPVLVVEGMTDVATAMELGFVAVGRPSNLSCIQAAAELLRNRDVVILGENDRKPDGREPGRDGMVAAFQVIQRTAKSARMCMPPAHAKDLRQWAQGGNLTAADLLDHVETYGQVHSEQTIYDTDNPPVLARAYLDDRHTMAGKPLIRRWQETWYQYDGVRFTAISNEAFEAPIIPWTEGKQVAITNHQTGASYHKPVRCDNLFLNNLLRSLKSAVFIPPETPVPCWVNGVEGPDPLDLISFPNGLLHIPAFLAGESEDEYLLEPTPDFFTTTGLPFNFDATQTCPQWEAFLQQVLGYEPACIDLLQEWFGYSMTAETRFHKLMFLRGPTAAGKSVIVNMLRHLVGPGQATATDFDTVVGEHGLEDLVGKLICTIGDSRVTDHRVAARGLARLLNLTGQDAVAVNGKHKTIVSHRLTCKLTIASNEFLDVQDHSSALERRLNHLEFVKSFAGQEDFYLEDKLISEVPGIAVWALRGLARLRRTGRFTFPESSKEALKEWRTGTSPMAAFIEECTDPDRLAEIPKRQLYDAWVGWSNERSLKPITFARFKERVRSNAPYVHSDTPIRGQKKCSVFRGIALRDWAAKQYLGKVLPRGFNYGT